MLNRNHSLMSYNPFTEMENFERNFFKNPFSMLDLSNVNEFRTDITDEGDHYNMQIDLPGYDKKDVKIDVDGDVLTISAERHSEHEEKDKRGKYVRCERTYGSYSRSFDMAGINSADVKAKYADGVLTLTLPKKDKEIISGRRLEIE